MITRAEKRSCSDFAKTAGDTLRRQFDLSSGGVKWEDARFQRSCERTARPKMKRINSESKTEVAQMGAHRSISQNTSDG